MTATVEDIETLRRAAELMRVRAEAATPGPWVVRDDDVQHYFPHIGEYGSVASPHQSETPHIASWHPAVALAVADLLDRLACSCHPADDDSGHCVPREALTVARAYLGESA